MAGDSKSKRKLELLLQTGLLLSKQLDLHTVVQSATDAGLQLCDAQFGAFFYNIIDASGESYLLYTLSGVDREKFSQFPMPRNTAVFGPTFEGVGVVRSGDITQDPRYGHNPPYRGMPEGHLPVRSYLAVPVKAQSGEVLGGLFYGHENTDVFEEESEDLVGTIAAQAAIAIENFRLREQLTRKIKDLEESELEQRAMVKNLSELAAIVESSDDAIVGKDLTGRITSWNQAASRIFGYAPEEIIGSSILILIPTELHSEETGILEKIRAGQRIHHYETVRVKRNGERLAVSLSISPIRDGSGNIVGASKILRDITRQKRMEASLIQAEKIAATGRMAASLAHEVNNPLEAVTNLIYLAKSNAVDADQVRSLLNTAEGEVARVSHIAKQTLGFYREHSSAVSASVSDLATYAIKVYEQKCKDSGIDVQMNFHSTRKIVLRKGEILQVVSSLIANAIYAMPSGGRLSISTEDIERATGDGVRIMIEDTGIGISDEQLPKIFDAFYTTRSTIGTGIGLFVAKQFIEAHGGSIEVQSRIDAIAHGTRMSVFLPYKNQYLSTEIQLFGNDQAIPSNRAALDQ